jgi:uncharacterized protein (DUF433 family)
MARTSEKIAHPYIVARKHFCGGSPIIVGTKFPVRAVIQYVLRQGLTAEELVREFPHLTLAQVYDALSYYYDHQADMERELAEHSEEKLRPQGAE